METTLFESFFKIASSLVVGLILFLHSRIWARNKEIDTSLKEVDHVINEMKQDIIKIDLKAINRDDLTGAINRNRDDFLTSLEKLEEHQKERDESGRRLLNTRIDNLTDKIEGFDNKFSDLADLIKGALKDGLR